MNAPDLKIAIRAVGRIAGPKIIASEIGTFHDAGFDGGEFSGPAHSRYEEEVFMDAVRLVASRFGMTPDGLINAIHLAAQEEEYRRVYGD
jgi:hypothetical protein